MRRVVASLCRRFARSKRGVAAIEFAMIMPILLMLFLTSFDAGNGIAVYMKVRSATYVLAAITNTYGTGSNAQITPAAMTTITSATANVLAPYTGTPTVVLTQVRASSKTAATVSWSYSVNGTALTQGSSYTSLPTNFAKNSCGSHYPCYLVLASVSYTYTPLFGSFFTGPVTLSDSLYVAPRISVCIQYNGTPSLPC